MAGNKNSGRRGAPRNDDGSFADGGDGERKPPTRPFPKLEPSHASCRDVSAWVAEQVAFGTISDRSGDVILSAVAKVTASLRSDFSERELAEMREINQQMKDSVDEMKRREALGRGAAIGDARPVTGRTKVTDVA